MVHRTAVDIGRMHILPPAGGVSHLATSTRDFALVPHWDLRLGTWNCVTSTYTPGACPGDPMAALNTAADEWSPTLDPSGLHVVFQRGLNAPVLWCASRLTTAMCFGAPVPVTIAGGIGPGLLRDPQFGFTRNGLTLFFRRSVGPVDTVEGAPYATATCTLGPTACVIATAPPGREVYLPTPMNDSRGTTRCMVFGERGTGDLAPHVVQFTSSLEANAPIQTLLTSPANSAFEIADANCGTLTFVFRAVPEVVGGWRYVHRMGICALSSLTTPAFTTGDIVLFGPERCTGEPFLGLVMLGLLNGFSFCPGAGFTGCLGIDILAQAFLALDRCSSTNMPVPVTVRTGCPAIHTQAVILTLTPLHVWFSNTAQICVGAPCF